MAAERGRRRFVTTRQVEDARDAGAPLLLAPRDVITDEARQRARDLGVEVRREKAGEPAGAVSAPAAAPASAATPEPAAASAPTPAPAPSPGAVSPVLGEDGLREIVVRALREELGDVEADLEAVYDAVMARLGR